MGTVSPSHPVGFAGGYPPVQQISQESSPQFSAGLGEQGDQFVKSNQQKSSAVAFGAGDKKPEEGQPASREQRKQKSELIITWKEQPPEVQLRRPPGDSLKNKVRWRVVPQGTQFIQSDSVWIPKKA